MAVTIDLSPILLSSRSLHLNNYTLDKVIGIGSSGVVCKYIKDGISYAVKLVPSINLSSMISREIAILTRLNQYDLAVPRLYDYGMVSATDIPRSLIDNTKPYYGIVMEFIDGINLEEYVEDFTFDEMSIRNVAIWLFDTLRHLHRLNIVHRDIKPSNIMFRSNKYLYLIDFGFACVINEGSLCSSHIIGTPTYIGPEGWSGHIDTAYRYKGLDVWAAGVTLYYLVYGEPPWFPTEKELRKLDATGQRELLRTKILYDPFRLYPYPINPTDAVTLKIIAKALIKNPDERPSADELYLELTT